MLGLFKQDPIKKLQKEYEQKLVDAMRSQRNGDIRTYSMLSEEADALLKKIEQLETNPEK